MANVDELTIELNQDLVNEINRLRKLVAAKDEAIELLIDEAPYSDKWHDARRQAKAALELK